MAERASRAHGEVDELTESREIIAHMAEADVRIPVMKEVIATARRFLRRAGFGVQWRQTELETLIARAGRRLRQDRTRARGSDRS